MRLRARKAHLKIKLAFLAARKAHLKIKLAFLAARRSLQELIWPF
jgi:hypothetical protein